MKAAEIREINELKSWTAKLKDLKAELFNLRFQLAINQLDNPMRINAVKKDIARVKTIHPRERAQGRRQGVTEGRIKL